MRIHVYVCACVRVFPLLLFYIRYDRSCFTHKELSYLIRVRRALLPTCYSLFHDLSEDINDDEEKEMSLLAVNRVKPVSFHTTQRFVR